MALPFTLEDVDAAYAKTGMKPVRKTWVEFDGHCGCVLTALVAAKHGLENACMIGHGVNGYGHASELLGITKEQVFGIIDGFDGEGFSKGYDAESYKFGRAAWDRVKHLATTTTTTD
jgi:hypothetical protein